MVTRRVKSRTNFFFYATVAMLGAVVCFAVDLARAEEQGEIEGVKPPSPISPDEPISPEFSLRRAVDYLDNAALDWQQRRRCVTCHTNGLFLASRAEVGPQAPANDLVREYFRDYLERFAVEQESDEGKRKAPIEGIVAATALLAISDVKTTGELGHMTRRAIDYIWTQQSEEDCWEEWQKCNWPPFEVDDHFGVTLVALALGMVPDDYAQTPAAQEGLRKLRHYLTEHPPENTHQQAMVLLASTTCDGLLTHDEQQDAIARLFSLQKADGGWNVITLGNWKRSDGKEQDVDSSDGYATGFVTYVLRRSGVARDDPRIQKAIDWLKANQRASGRWFTRSPRRDGKHYISHAGTSYAVMALAECGESLAPAQATEDR